MLNFSYFAERQQTNSGYLFAGHQIEVVDTLEDLIKVADLISKADVVGVDTEWKPSFMSLTEQVNFLSYVRIQLNLFKSNLIQLSLRAFSLCKGLPVIVHW